MIPLMIRITGVFIFPLMILDCGGVYLPLFTIIPSRGVYLTLLRLQILGVLKDSIFYHPISS